MNYSKGISWFDDCRIPFVDEVRTIPVHSEDKKDDTTLFGLHATIQRKRIETTEGRYPANLLCSDDVLNDGSISKSNGRKIYANEDTNIKNNVLNKGWVRTKSDIKDKGSNSRYYDIDAWFNNLLENNIY